VAPSSIAPASEVILPPSNPATTARPSSGVIPTALSFNRCPIPGGY
jgi:hypothetical protein